MTFSGVYAGHPSNIRVDPNVNSASSLADDLSRLSSTKSRPCSRTHWPLSRGGAAARSPAVQVDAPKIWGVFSKHHSDHALKFQGMIEVKQDGRHSINAY